MPFKEPQLARPTLTFALAMVLCVGAAPQMSQAAACATLAAAPRSHALRNEESKMVVALLSPLAIDNAAKRHHRLVSTHLLIEPWHTARLVQPTPTVRTDGLLQPPPLPTVRPPLPQLLNLPPPALG